MFLASNRKVLWPILALLLAARAQAGDLILRDSLKAYGDNTEFFEPFRLRETLLGQQWRSFLELRSGEKVFLQCGLFADHRSAQDSALGLLPILSFVYRSGGGEGTLGTLQPVGRHGLAEPLQSTAFELTRPVEYGLQWVQREGPVLADLFLDWQQLLTPLSREVFDYGGKVQGEVLSGVALEGEAHCYHVGGVTYGGVVRNNFAGGAGIRFHSLLPVLGEGSLEGLVLFSNDTQRTSYPGPVNGSGVYVRGSLSPWEHAEIFGIAWRAGNFMSEEGDPNYNSLGYDGVFYKADRNYEEAGIRYSLALEGGASFAVELRSHWVEDSWAHSFRITAAAPFDIEIMDVHPVPAAVAVGPR